MYGACKVHSLPGEYCFVSNAAVFVNLTKACVFRLPNYRSTMQHKVTYQSHLDHVSLNHFL